MHFGKGQVKDVNMRPLDYYNRVMSSCPTDGHFSYVPYTSDCFRGDWHTITEDHTPGDQDGNMLLINASYNAGAFLNTTIVGLKAATTYEFSVWLMNVCRISEKCPFPLLPNLTIKLQTTEGQVIAQFNTGDIPRVHEPAWTQHRAVFTTPAKQGYVNVIMTNNAPGGCGNDFALDDITFRECIKQPPPITKAQPKPAVQKPAVTVAQKPTPKKPPPAQPKVTEVKQPTIQTSTDRVAVLQKNRDLFPPPPAVLTNRDNSLVKRIETPPAEIRIELYDNGEIDGDTVSIYHNNVLIKSQARLSATPISFSISVNESQPYHELVMVANNLGSIPPNTSVMIITAGTARHELFISSTEQKNAKVILDLKK